MDDEEDVSAMSSLDGKSSRVKPGSKSSTNKKKKKIEGLSLPESKEQEAPEASCMIFFYL
jgi:hypothetical protein